MTFAKPSKGHKMRPGTIRGAIHRVAVAMLEHGRLKPYEIQHSLEALDLFWTGVVNRTKKLEDYSKFFGETEKD
jgi:hypothetical protein